MSISNKEYNHKGIQGCRCKYCWNSSISKLPSVNNSRNYIKRDTVKEYENSLGLYEAKFIESSIEEEDDYTQGYEQYLEESILRTLTEEQRKEYLE